ncbi:MAG: site-2 protease family protein [Bryobacteraceae bacterium]
MSRLGSGFVLCVIVVILLSGVFLRLVLCFVVSVIAHEIGHLAAGVIVGREFREIMAGPFVLSRESGGLRFRFLPRRLLRGGHVRMAQKALWSRRSELIMVAGGPMATALLFVPVALLPWSPLTICFLLANALVAVGSWVPMTVRGQPSDAKSLLNLARAPAEYVAALRDLWALDNGGIGPRNWPPEAVDKLVAAGCGGPYLVTTRQLFYIYLRECPNPGQAAEALESVLACAANLTPDERRSYFAEAAFFQGVYGNNSALAREWLDDARKVNDALPEEDWESYPLAAIELAEGSREPSREHFAQAIAALDRHPGASGSRAALRARLVALKGS